MHINGRSGRVKSVLLRKLKVTFRSNLAFPTGQAMYFLLCKKKAGLTLPTN